MEVAFSKFKWVTEIKKCFYNPHQNTQISQDLQAPKEEF